MIENHRTEKTRQPSPPIEYVEEESSATTDADKDQAILSQLQSWWRHERAIQAENRVQMALDEDYADGDQWSKEDKAEVLARGQAPLVFNLIKPAVEWISGTEKKTRVDWKVMPREKSDEPTAKPKTELLKYIQDVNKGGYKRSHAFKDGITVGLGWIDHDVCLGEEEKIRLSWECWRNVWHDHLAREFDLSDGRYIFRARVMDLDKAIARWPAHEETFKQAANRHGAGVSDFGFYHSEYVEPQFLYENANIVGSIDNAERKVVLVVECQYRKYIKVKRFKGHKKFKNRVYDDGHPGMQRAVEKECCELLETPRNQVFHALFLDAPQGQAGTLIQHVISPYDHNRFTLVPIWGYRRGRDNLPYGPVRNMRDPQDDLNKRHSKSLFILSTKQVVMDKGAVDDIDELIEAVADPQGVIEKKKGYELEINQDNTLAQQHIDLADRDAAYIRETSGVTSENLGLESNAISGKAITAKQVQGGVVTQSLFDNLRLHMQLSGEITLSLIEQFYDEEKEFRITGERGTYSFQTINGTDPITNEPINSIVDTQADFVVSEQDFNATIRAATAESLMNVIGTLPGEVAIQLLDVALDVLDIPGMDEIVKRIRKINGHPDADEKTEEELAAEEKAQEEAEAQAQAKAQAQQDAIFQAELAEKHASVELKKSQAESQRMKKTVDYIDALSKAIESAGIALTAPEVAAIADSMVAEGMLPNPDPHLDNSRERQSL